MNFWLVKGNFLVMISRIFFIILLIATNVKGAEIQQNHLNPELSVFTDVVWLTDYYSRLVEIFSEAYDNNLPMNSILIRAIVTPSFKNEYAIGVRRQGDKYIAFKLTAEDSVWVKIRELSEKNKLGNLQQLKIGVNVSEMELSKQLYTSINKSWQKMIMNTKYPQNAMTGLDGISYHFTDSNLRSGRTWSPEPESQTGYLVKLTELLGQFTESQEPKKIEIKLLNTAAKLNASFN